MNTILTYDQMVDEVNGMIDMAIIEAYPDATNEERAQAREEFLQTLGLLLHCDESVVH